MTTPKTEILVNMEWVDVITVNLDLTLLSYYWKTSRFM